MRRAERRGPRLVFACGREPDYIRNRLLARGLARAYPVAVVASNRAGYPARLAEVLPRLARAAKRADLIVAGFLGQPIAVFAARLLRKPVLLDAFVSVYDTLCLDRRVAAPKSPLGRLAFTLDREAVRCSRLSLVDTDCQRHFFAETFKEPPGHFAVHYVGPDLDSGCMAEQHDDRPGSIVVLHYGSYLPLHGADVIVEAAQLLRDDSSIRFRLIGTGCCRRQAQARAERLGLRNVAFVDWLEPAALQREIQRASIGLGGHFAVNPKARRVIAGKTFQLLAAGIPTIVGDCPANRELFQPDCHVAAVPMGDPVALAATIQSLARDSARRQRLGAAGAALMRERFAPERVTAELRRAVEVALG